MDSKLFHELMNQLAIFEGMNKGAIKLLATMPGEHTQTILDCEKKIQKALKASEKVRELLSEYRKTIEALSKQKAA